MTLIIELVCPSCSKENCHDHITTTLKKDHKIGLEFEIRCICNKHSKEVIE